MGLLNFSRTKYVGITETGEGLLRVHGVLDDTIYALELDLLVAPDTLELLDVQGKWNRWTTPECPRATAFLVEAVGFRIGEEGFADKVQKIVGRKACRHYANLMIECSHAVRQAVLVGRYEEARKADPGLGFEAFLKGEKTPGGGHAPVVTVPTQAAPVTTRPETWDPPADGMVIDLHLHSFPASRCSSAEIEALILEAKRIGLQGICLTDHNVRWEPATVEDLRQRHGFPILRGNEITTDQGDMLVFGLEIQVEGIVRLEALREMVTETGGIIIAAHPFRGFLTFGVTDLGLTPEKAMERPLFRHCDAMEVLNSKVTDRENALAWEVASRLGLPMTGGSDAHAVAEVGVYATWFPDPIKDERDLIAAIAGGRSRPVAFRKPS